MSRQAKLLFKPFSQIDSALTRKHDGTGLGLVICDRLAKMMHVRMILWRTHAHTLTHIHQGRVWAESKKGRGSVFSFVLKMGTGYVCLYAACDAT